MLTTELVNKVARMYKDGSPDDHGEFADLIQKSDDMGDIVARLCGEQMRAALRLDPLMAIATAILLVEIGYKLAKTEIMEEAFNIFKETE